MMNLNVLRNGQSIYMREQPFGGNTLTQEIQRAFRHVARGSRSGETRRRTADNYDVEVLEPFMDTLGLEVARALQFFFTSTQFNQVNHILLAGGCAAITGHRRSRNTAHVGELHGRQSVREHGAVVENQAQEPGDGRPLVDGRLWAGNAEV